MDKEIVQKTLELLGKYATKKRLINYSELYEKLGLDTENPSDRNIGSNILAEVNHITIKKNNTMLSALVTLKGNQSPADGFYEFATELKLLKKSSSEIDKLAFWAKQVKKAFKVYDK